MFATLKASIHFCTNISRILLSSIFYFVCKKERKDISKDIILVTGGGKGIGKKIALNFAKHAPSHIILWGRTKSALEETSKEIQELGVSCTPMVCDVSDKENIYKCAEIVQKSIGDVTILVNNAGVVYGDSILDSSYDHIENTFNVNTLSHFWTLKAFLPSMMAKDHGHIVEISSVLGIMGLIDAGDYCSSKFGVNGLVDSLYDELKNTNIDITTIYPYVIANDMFDGIQTRISQFIPPLSEDYVAKRTVEGVLTRRHKVILPKIMYFVSWFSSNIPLRLQYILIKATGAHKAMKGVHSKSN